MRALTTLAMTAALSTSSRHNQDLPQHRGVQSGGDHPTLLARSPKHGGRNQESLKDAKQRLTDLQKIESFENLITANEDKLVREETTLKKISVDLTTLQDMMEEPDEKQVASILKSYKLEMEPDILPVISKFQEMRDETKSNMQRVEKKLSRLNRTLEGRANDFQETWGRDYQSMQR